LNPVPLAALHAVLTAAVIFAAPRAVRTAAWTAGTLWVGACAVAGLLSGSVLGAALGLAGALIPFLLTKAFGPHAWLPLVLLLNGHPLALLAARLFASLPSEARADARPKVVAVALLAAAAAALLAYAQTRPRRVLLGLIASQSALILAGLTGANAGAVAGALAVWQTAAVAVTMMACVCAGLAARVGPALDRPGYLGLAAAAPRLAVFCLIAAFALGDLPLTMGFPAAELLLRGLLEDGLAGLALPVIAALNAFVALRMTARLFWGRASDETRDMPDALPRERWTLSAGLLFLLFGGLLPSALLP